ncbi:hypothetical protein ABIB40_002342 [Pedobacter sp. UYP30]|uniref:SusE domain-containing protein n=1 Tax=Pedobacter sp. UYP30 TaxID=1756400 RepID=UPI00339A6E00
MKSIFLKSMALSLIALSLWSCKKEETRAVATDGAPGALKASATSVVVDKSMLTTDVITFDMSNANFGYQAAVSNVLQIAPKGSNFAEPSQTILDANATSKSFNGLDFNNLLLGLKLPSTSNSDIEVRVKSTISNDVAPVYSNVLTISAKPFPLTAWVYVPGAYQGWNPSAADSLISPTGNGIYTGIIGFDGGNFKITPKKTWDVAYGDAGGGKISTTGGDIKSLTPGAKELVVDLNQNTITITDVVWAAVGSATPSDWPPASGPYNELDMKFVGNNTWTITLPLKVGEMKFRKNHKWDNSIGDGGDNIKITEAGTYDISLTINPDFNTGSYTVVKK